MRTICCYLLEVVMVRLNTITGSITDWNASYPCNQSISYDLSWVGSVLLKRSPGLISVRRDALSGISGDLVISIMVSLAPSNLLASGLAFRRAGQFHSSSAWARTLHNYRLDQTES